MTFNSNFGQNRQGPKTDLREWMLNQQRQFQEFDDSFGMPSAFGSSFGSFRDPFDDSFFSSPFPARGGFPSLSFSPSHRAAGTLMAPPGTGRFSTLVDFNIPCCSRGNKKPGLSLVISSLSTGARAGE